MEEELALPGLRVVAEDTSVHVAHGNRPVGQFGEGADIGRTAGKRVIKQLPLVQVQLINSGKGGGEPDASGAIQTDIVDVIGLYDGIIVLRREVEQRVWLFRGVVDIEAVVYGREEFAPVGQLHVV